MAYLKPPWFTRAVFNKIAIATGMSNTEKLTVTRRRSKQRQEVPVITVDVGGTKYLVSTRGESEWVKNLRADPNATIGSTAYVARDPRTGPPSGAHRLPRESRPRRRRLLPKAASRGRPPGVRRHSQGLSHYTL